MPITLNCQWCKQDFSVAPHAAVYRKYCSKKCFGLADRGSKRPQGKLFELECIVCYKKFHRTKSTLESRACKFCSQKCNAKHKSINSPTSFKRTCKVCQKDWMAPKNRKRSKTCSKKCHSLLMKTKPNLTCRCCNKVFLPRSSHKQKYCSVKCGAKIRGVKSRKPTLRICPKCGKEFHRKSGIKQLRCSLACSAKRGKYHHKWAGGITPLNKKLRTSPKTNDWRKKVFYRDKFTCQHCNTPTTKENRIPLNAHHVKPWAKFPELRWEVSNGITLCFSCHKEEHKRIRAVLASWKSLERPSSQSLQVAA